MNIIRPVQSNDPCRQSGGGTSSLLIWEGFVEKYVLSLEWKSEGVMDTVGQSEPKFIYFVSEERSQAGSESSGWSGGW